jgi:hypothetical protein
MNPVIIGFVIAIGLTRPSIWRHASRPPPHLNDSFDALATDQNFSTAHPLRRQLPAGVIIAILTGSGTSVACFLRGDRLV